MTITNKIEIKGSTPQEIAAVMRSLASSLMEVAGDLESGKVDTIFGEKPFGIAEAAAELAFFGIVPVLTGELVEPAK